MYGVLLMTSLKVRPATEKEYDAVKLCIARSFADDPDNPGMPVFMKAPMLRNDYLWGAFVDGSPVAGTMLVPFELEIDGCRIRVIGLTGVGTDPDFRRKGYASRLLEGIHEFVAGEGFDGMVLHSAADMLYRKLDYEFAFCAWEGSFSADMLEEFESKAYSVDFLLPMEIQSALVDDLNKIRSQSGQFQRRNMKVVRTDETFAYQLKNMLTLRGYMLAVLRNSDDILGYSIFRAKDRSLSIVELMPKNPDEETYACLLKGITDEFTADFKEVKISLYTEDYEIIRMIEKYSGSVTKRYLTGNMVCIFDPAEILRKLEPAFNRRLNANEDELRPIKNKLDFKIDVTSQFTGKRSIISFKFDPKEPVIQMERTKVIKDLSGIEQVVRVNWDEFTALVFGFVELDDTEILENKQDPEIQSILAILFPPLEPIWDYFHEY